MKNSKNGFTLAEVLVTLAIIGVVAALTIPSLMQNTNSTKYITSLKKNISVLNSALKNNIANNDMNASDPSITNSTKLAAWFVTGNANGIAGTTPPTNLNVLRWAAADPTSVWLTDGTRLTFFNAGGIDCPLKSITAFGLAAGGCYVVVDTNGDRKPNKIATDAGTGAYDVWLLAIIPNNVSPVIITTGSPPFPTTNINGGVLSPAYSPTSLPASGNRASYAAITGAT